MISNIRLSRAHCFSSPTESVRLSCTDVGKDAFSCQISSLRIQQSLLAPRWERFAKETSAPQRQKFDTDDV